MSEAPRRRFKIFCDEETALFGNRDRLTQPVLEMRYRTHSGIASTVRLAFFDYELKPDPLRFLQFSTNLLRDWSWRAFDKTCFRLQQLQLQVDVIQGLSRASDSKEPIYDSQKAPQHQQQQAMPNTRLNVDSEMGDRMSWI